MLNVAVTAETATSAGKINMAVPLENRASSSPTSPGARAATEVAARKTTTAAPPDGGVSGAG
ncbi:hypothetical protein [Micromonospora sp. NPDC001898]|uniref:hypothetical protein n=1 Tax=Micromonospora sp. NPDC001898 TaxID=3364221 RepID=UPI0036CCE47D